VDSSEVLATVRVLLHYVCPERRIKRLSTDGIRWPVDKRDPRDIKI
jgi:hypothetical protein